MGVLSRLSSLTYLPEEVVNVEPVGVGGGYRGPVAFPGSGNGEEWEPTSKWSLRNKSIILIYHLGHFFHVFFAPSWGNYRLLILVFLVPVIAAGPYDDDARKSVIGVGPPVGVQVEYGGEEAAGPGLRVSVSVGVDCWD